MTRSADTGHWLSGRRTAGAVRAVRMFPMRIVAGGAAAVALALMSGAPPAASAADASADQRRLGHVTSVAWSVRTPVRARLKLRPFVGLNVQKRALHLLGAREPRVSGRFVARIGTRPARGQARTLAVVSRRVKDRAIRPSSVRSIAGRDLRFRRSVLNRRQTARVKRAAKRQPLAIVARVRYRVRYTDDGGETAATPIRSARTVLPLSLERPKARGAKLRNLARSLRRVIVRVRRAEIACTTRETIVGRLRTAYGTLVSGDRTGAAELLRVWIADARLKAAAGVLGETHASRLRAGLREVLKRVGSGRSKRLDNAPRLPRVPRCESSAHEANAAGEPTHYQAAAIAVAVKAVTGAVSKLIHTAARVHTRRTLRNIKNTLWPPGPDGKKCTAISCDGDSVYDIMKAEDDITDAAQTLDSLQQQLDWLFEVETGVKPSDYGQPGPWGYQWQIVEAFFTQEAGPVFQKEHSEIPLLPLYAQYENLHLSLLQYGVLNGARMGFKQTFIRQIQDKLEDKLAEASDYTTAFFTQAVHAKKHYDDNQKQYASKNPEWVHKRVQVLDFRDLWPLQDPVAYPYGDPTFRQTRMIYSDEWGRTHDSKNFPEFGMDDATGDLTNPPMPNVENPLTRFTAWMKQEWTKSYEPNGDYRNFLAAIQVDNAPAEGPITGDSALTPDQYGARPARSSYAVGPGSTIVEVGATWAERDPLFYPQNLIQVLKLNFNDDSSEVPGGAFYKVSNRTGYWSYPDEVLATAKIIGRYEWSKNNYTGNAIVFGFRFEDSFLPPAPPVSGRVTPPSWSNDQVCLAIEQMTLQGGEDFAHNGEETGKRQDVALNQGPEVQMYDCGYAGWKGTATWETTWSYEASGDPQKGELTVFGGTKCAAPDPADPNAVRIQDCAGTAPQMWTPRQDGTIANAQSGRCLERPELANGSPVRLNDCSYVDGSTPVPEQRWSWPAGWATQPPGG
jgi:hypothetical protein